MSEWRVARLSDVCEIVGRGITPQYVDDGPITVVNQKCIREGRLDLAASRRHGGRTVTAPKLIQEGDVLVNSTGVGTLGRTAAVQTLEGPTTVDTHVTIARPSTADPGWVRYLFRLLEPSIEALAEGSTGQTELSRHRLAELEVLVPSLSEQREIAEVLGALDDKVESNHRILETAKQLLAAEYQSVVGSAGVEPYGLRLEVQMGAPFKGEHFSEVGQGRPLIRIRDLKTFSSQVWTTDSRPDETVISPGDILVGMDAEFRSTIWLGDTGVLNQRMCRFLGRKGVSRCFVWLAIQPELEYCERAKSGTTVIHLNKGDIDKFTVPSLSNEQHAQLSTVTEPIFDRLVVAGREITSLSSLRDALLPELLSGRLRVKDAEKIVEGEV